jgi:hypothetical protein
MASFITTMFVAPPLTDFSPKPFTYICPHMSRKPSCPNFLHESMMAEFHSSQSDDIRPLNLQCESTRNARTRSQFKPRNANKGTSSYQLRQFAEATLGSGSLRKAVKLPDGEDLNEWLAVNGGLNSLDSMLYALPAMFVTTERHL